MSNMPVIRPPPGDAPEHEKRRLADLGRSNETPVLLSVAGGHPREGNKFRHPNVVYI